MGSDEQPEPIEAALEETQTRELTPVELPGPDELSALAELAESMPKVAGDPRAREAIARGLLKDLAASFDPDTRRDPPGHSNSVSARVVEDFAALLTCFDSVAIALGYNPPAPNQRRYRGPELRLRYCRINRCDVSMQTIRWPIDLCGCRMHCLGMFMGATFASRAGFEHCSFEAGADFGLAKFQGDASFSAAAFTATSAVSATFAGVTFCRHADFDVARFSAAVQFDYGTFEDQTRFFRCQFAGAASFVDTKFRAEAQFEFAAFKDRADFSSVVFDKAPEFHKAGFAAGADFSAAELGEYLDLRGVAFGPAASLSLADLRIRASGVMGGNVRLTSSQLRRSRRWPLGWDSLIESDSRGKIKAAAEAKLAEAEADEDADAVARARRAHDKALKDTHQSLVSACTQYGVLEENFRAQGDPDSRAAEDFCHYRYHDLWRQTHRRRTSPLYLANWFFLKLCFGYGVYPLRILVAGVMLIVMFACMYATGGFGLGGDDWRIETDQTVTAPATAPSESAAAAQPETHQVTRCICLSQIKGWSRWGTALYFSTTTFTTVGYGDWRPTGAAQAAAASEGLLGVLIMSIFTVVFARKFIR